MGLRQLFATTRSLGAWTAALIGFVAFSNNACAAIQYTVTDIGALSGSNFSYAEGINNLGQVVGFSYVSGGSASLDGDPYEGPGTWHAVIYSNGHLTDLGTFGGENSIASAINDSGQIVGTIVTATGTRAFLYSGGTETDLGTLGGSNAYALAINKTGQITGYSYTGAVNKFNEPLSHGFIYSGGNMTDLGTATGFDNSYPAAINAGGQIVGDLYASTGAPGDNPFLYSNGQLTDDLNQVHMNDLAGINDSGQIVGYQSSGQAFLYSNGVTTSLGLNIIPRAINNSAQIVGFQTDILQHETAIIDVGGVTTNLNSLIDPTLGWNLQEALDINNVGQIVGFGTDSSGFQHGFILTPVPEPGAIHLIVFGMAALLGSRPAIKRGVRIKCAT